MKKVQYSKETFPLAASMVPMGILVFRVNMKDQMEDWTCEYINDWFKNLLGSKKKSFLKKPLSDILKSVIDKKAKALCQKAISSKALTEIDILSEENILSKKEH